MGAGPAVKVPLQLVTRERWQDDSGDTCLGGAMGLGAQEGWSQAMPGLQARPPQAGSAAGFVLGQGQWVLGPSNPGQHPQGTALDPPRPASRLGEPNSPKSLCKCPPARAPAPPSSGGLCTVKGSVDPSIPISQPPPTSLPHGELSSGGTHHGDMAPQDPCRPGHLGYINPATAPGQPWGGQADAHCPISKQAPQPPWGHFQDTKRYRDTRELLFSSASAW